MGRAPAFYINKNTERFRLQTLKSICLLASRNHAQEEPKCLHITTWCHVDLTLTSRDYFKHLPSVTKLKGEGCNFQRYSYDFTLFNYFVHATWRKVLNWRMTYKWDPLYKLLIKVWSYLIQNPTDGKHSPVFPGQKTKSNIISSNSWHCVYKTIFSSKNIRQYWN
jgi:hypothetical protein